MTGHWVGHQHAAAEDLARHPRSELWPVRSEGGLLILFGMGKPLDAVPELIRHDIAAVDSHAVPVVK